MPCWYRLLFLALLSKHVVAPPDADEDEEDGRTSTTYSTAGLIYTVAACAAMVCSMCGHQSDEPSPLDDACDTDEFGGYRPWFRKRSHPSKTGFCAARGKLCRLCFTTFYLSSLATKHGSWKKYLKWAESQKSGQLAVFRKMLARWIKIHNDNPAAAKMQVRRELEEVEKVESTKSEGLREKNKYFAVEMEVWKKDNKGKKPEDYGLPGNQYLKEHGKVMPVLWIRKQKNAGMSLRTTETKAFITRRFTKMDS